MPVAIALTVFGAAAALWTSRPSRLESRLPYALAKAIAAAGFVAVAVVAGALRSLPGTLLLAGLAASGVGDVALAFRGRAAFLGGTAAFALAHLGYAAAFVARGVSLPWLLASAVVAAAASLAAWRRLRPHLPPALVGPLAAYVALVSLMVALAWASFGAGAAATAAVGATAFYLSDLAVARERFVTHDPADKLWGLPLYYLAQVLIALSVR